MKNKVLDIISDTVGVSKENIDINKPLNEQFDIDSLDCAEIELEIQDKFNLDFAFTDVIYSDYTVQQVFDNIQKLLDEKKVNGEVHKKPNKNS